MSDPKVTPVPAESDADFLRRVAGRVEFANEFIGVAARLREIAEQVEQSQPLDANAVALWFYNAGFFNEAKTADDAAEEALGEARAFCAKFGTPAELSVLRQRAEEADQREAALVLALAEARRLCEEQRDRDYEHQLAIFKRNRERRITDVRPVRPLLPWETPR